MAFLNLVGLVLNLLGVVGLFFFGVPFKVDIAPRGYAPMLYKTGGASDSEERRVRLYKKLGVASLVSILAGKVVLAAVGFATL